VSEDHAIALVDEAESGLEPYRQRSFVKKLHGAGRRQSFIITHSPFVLEMVVALDGAIWRIGKITPSEEPSADSPSHKCVNLMEDAKLKAVLQKNPEALLARLPIVCEGKTELGFTEILLEQHFGQDYRSRGIHPFEAGGNEEALKVCQKFKEAGILSLYGRKCTRSFHPKWARGFRPNCTSDVHPERAR
jgi:putative ATP-dependent endonuclease of OLD family